MLRLPERHLKRVTLELGLKVFTRLDDNFIRQQCELAFDNWRRLVADADRVSVLLWIGDGDEVFNWRGDPADHIRWNDSVGFSNLKYNAYPRSRHYETWYSRPYIPDPPTITYDDLRRIIRTLRDVARERHGIDITVGETIDAGPEFVESEFKFERHPEILKGGPASDMPKSLAFLCCYAEMNGDDYPYAGFPDGLPAGTTFGTFLGRQFQSLAEAVGFDYVWLSNGFGLTHYAWSYLGEVFNGLELHPERAPESIRNFRRFWADFRKQCPRLPIEIRGTNYSIGMDATVHGIDIREIYRTGQLGLPAPNPPWGAVNMDLEMVSHMSRISSTPGREILLRFYVNDSWFAAVPWHDKYGREPFDIYCPMSVCRLTETGEAETPTDFNVMTVNTGYGEMPPTQASEVEPHVRRAFDMAPDEAGPVIWVYPFSEYQDELHKADGKILKSWFGDWFVAKSIAGGVPLNTVMTTDNFAKCVQDSPEVLAGKLLVVPTPAADWRYADKVLDFVRSGGQALFYGSLHDAPKPLLRALNVAIDEPIEGDLDVSLKMAEDDYAKAPRKNRPLKHIGRLCDGGVTEVLADRDDSSTEVRATVRHKGKRRVYALVRGLKSWKGGKLGWIRGTLPFDARPDSLEPKLFGNDTSHNAGLWTRYLLRDFGYHIHQRRHDVASRGPFLFPSRRRGAWVFNGHAPESNVEVELSFPDGAPILCDRQTYVRKSTARYTFDRTLHLECQAFVRQQRESQVAHKELRITPDDERLFRVSGLKDATVALYVPREAITEGRLQVKNVLEYVIHDPTIDVGDTGFERDENGWPIEPVLEYTVDPVTGAAVVENVTGAIEVSY